MAIDLSQNEKEQQIFDTINSLGVRLIRAELPQNYLFDRRNLAVAKPKWLKIFESTDATTPGRRARPSATG